MVGCGQTHESRCFGATASSALFPGQGHSLWKAPKQEAASLGTKILGDFSGIVSTLEPSVQKRFLPLLSELKREQDESFLLHGLLTIGVRLKLEQEDRAAQLLLERLSRADIPEEIRGKAAQEYGAMAGTGSFGMRAEYLGSRLAEGSTHGWLIAPMLGATVLGQLVGTTVLGRLLGSASRGFWSRGVGARLAAGAASYLVEFPAFASLSMAVSPASGSPFSDALASSALTLGAMRLFAGGGLVPAFAARPLFHNGSIFLGLLAANKLEQHFNLRPRAADNATTAIDTLGSMLGILIGTNLGTRFLGRPFAAFRKEMEMRSDFSRFKEPKVDLRSSGMGMILPDAPRSSYPMNRVLAARWSRPALPAYSKEFEHPKKPNVLNMSKAKDSGGLDLELTAKTANSLYAFRTFISEVRSLRGAVMISSRKLDIFFSEIREFERFHYATQTVDTLLTEDFLHFQRMKVFPTLIRALAPSEQLDLAQQLYDKIEQLERAKSDLEHHVEQATSILNDLHSQNALPFQEKIRQGLENEESRRFAEACLAKIASKQKR